jgi:hypothetical protein
MRPPFKPPAPPKPIHEPGMVAAYLHSKSQQEMARRNRAGASSEINPSGREAGYSIPKKGSWLKRIFVVLVLLGLIVASLVIIGNSRSRPVSPKPPKTVRLR